MKRRITHSLIAAALLLLGHGTTTWAQFKPAPVDGPRLSFTTDKAVNETITLFFHTPVENVWIDLNSDGTYQKGEELASKQALMISAQKKALTIYGDLTGINCNNNQISKLDLKHMPNLIWLRCLGNNLKSLDLANKPKLEMLTCAENQLTKLDLSSAPNLTNFACYKNRIKEAAMQALIESLPTPKAGGYFFPINLWEETGAEGENILTTTQIELLVDKKWEVKDADGKDHPKGYIPAPIDGPHLSFTTERAIGDTIVLKIEAHKNNVWIDLNNDKLYQDGEKLEWKKDLKFQIQDKTLSIYGNVTLLDCKNNELIELKLSQTPFLQEIYCQENKLKSLDLSKISELKRLYCQQNQLKSLDLGNKTKLERLYCHSNQLKSLDLNKVPKLESLYCQQNQLTSLDLNKVPKLEWLYCHSNQLKSLDLGKVPEVYCVHCGNNQLTGLDLGKTPKLAQLYCYGNQINESAMGLLIESLPTVPKTDQGYFNPIDLKIKDGDKNICTDKQVELIKKKNWLVFDREGNFFPGTNGLQDISSSQLHIKLYAENGRLYITGLKEGMPIIVYTIDGSQVYNSRAMASELSIPLAIGSYVLHIGDYSAKAIMR